MILTIIDAAHEGCRDIHGYYVCTGEGAELHIFGWAATIRLAKKLRAEIRRNPASFQK